MRTNDPDTLARAEWGWALLTMRLQAAIRDFVSVHPDATPADQLEAVNAVYCNIQDQHAVRRPEVASFRRIPELAEQLAMQLERSA